MLPPRGPNIEASRVPARGRVPDRLDRKFGACRPPRVLPRPRGKLFLLGLAALIALFALPLPPSYQLALVWPRLAGAAMTLFGGSVTLVYAAATALGYR
ncbi:MAG TPA: hypothetical protein VNZ04_04875 [Trinickia sp.]|nr:hypothetical protein [Trinickia sp.]